MSRPALVVLAKAPIAGRTKTRLCPPLVPAEAAALAESALHDTLAAVAAVPDTRAVVVLDGEPGPWLPAGCEVARQRAGGLGERLAGAFATVAGPAVVIGMDTPQITPAQLDEALDALDRPGVDAVLGPAADGGYWTIGLRLPDERVFSGVPMSSPRTCAVQRARLRALGIRVAELEELRDVDTIDDAQAVAAESPGSRFAATLASLRGGAVATCAAAAAASIAACGSADEPPSAPEPTVSPPVTERPEGRVVKVGESPEGLTADPRTGLVAVGLRNPDRLALVDGGTGRVVRRVPLPESPRHLQLGAPSVVLVPAERADQLVEVLLPTGKRRAVTRVGRFPHDAAAAAGRVLVANEQADSVTIVDHGRAVRTLPAPRQPGGVAAARGSRVAVVGVRARRVALYDVVAERRIGELVGGVGPTHAVAVGSLVYVADTEGDAILVYRVRPRFELVDRANLPGAPYGLAADRRRRRLWVTLTERNEVIRYELTGRAPRRVASYPTVRQPNSVAVDERTGRVYVAGRVGSDLQILGR